MRKTAARDVGVYSGYGSEAWNDEVLVGDTTADYSSQIRALIRDAEGKDMVEAELVGDAETDGLEVSGKEKEGEGIRKPIGQPITIDRPMPRITSADDSNDLRSLNRKLDQSLYLLVKNKDGRWRFPEDRVYGRENIAQVRNISLPIATSYTNIFKAAERLLIQCGGMNMNTWVVGNHPIGHYEYSFPPAHVKTQRIPVNRLVSSSTEEIERFELGEKVFFMKGRLMAGQLDLSKNEYGDQDYHWLAKNEIETMVLPKYWSSVKNMLTDR